MYPAHPYLLSLSFLTVVLLFAGCQKNSSDQPTTRDNASGTAAQSSVPAGPTSKTDTPDVPHPPQPPAEPRVPLRPEPTWVIFREAYDDKADAELLSKWTGGNRLEITSRNVSRVTIDLTRLPPDAPQTGPWILSVDRQGIQITGARGKILDLVRSQNGDWSVDKEKQPLREAAP